MREMDGIPMNIHIMDDIPVNGGGYLDFVV